MYVCNLQWENHDGNKWFPGYSAEDHEKAVAFFWLRFACRRHPFSSLCNQLQIFNSSLFPAIEEKTAINN